MACITLTHVKGFRVALCCTSFVRSTKPMELYSIFAQAMLEFTVMLSGLLEKVCQCPRIIIFVYE